MDLVTGAMGNLPGKLLELLKDEYNLRSSVRSQVEYLSRELEYMHAALSKVAKVQHDQLDPQIKLWSREVREASYDIEDILDTILVRVDGGPQPADNKNWISQFLTMVGDFIGKVKTRREIASAIEGIKQQLEDMAQRRVRYKVDDTLANAAAITSIDPRLSALYTNVSHLVGIDGSMDQLIKMLSLGDDDEHNNKETKIVSVVGLGGLGKTTLAKAVHDNLKGGFDENAKAFVSVGRNPDFRKVFKDILIDLDKNRYASGFNLMILDERKLIDEIRESLNNKRYFIVIDDIWDISSWKTISYSMIENNLGSKIIITTRNRDVAEKIGSSSYNMEPLPYESSRSLFYGRIFGSKGACPGDLFEVSEKILKKCGGVPLAICTISSLLANKSRNVAEWHQLYVSIGSGLQNDLNMNNMRNILSLSYYDLPSHLKTCLLYLSIFPEDYAINIDRLILRWIAEDFVQSKSGGNLFDVGKSYVSELVNRSMIQLAHDSIEARLMDDMCRVHDVVLDLICFLARDENFVTLTDDIEQNTVSQRKIRRLSVQKISGATTSSNMSHLRSFIIFNPATASMPSLSWFDTTLRVLDLEGCTLKDLNMSYLGSLIQLRYLGLRNTDYDGDIPVEVGKLQFLQTLDLAWTEVRDLPASLVKLKRLRVLNWTGMNRPTGIRNLTELEYLSGVCIKEFSDVPMEELRVLRAIFPSWSESKKTLVLSRRDLRKMRKLVIYLADECELDCEAWGPPECLREFHAMGNDAPLRLLPAWVDATTVPQLTVLAVCIRELRQQDIDALGRLPALEVLYVESKAVRKALIVPGGAFPRLTYYRSHSSSGITPVLRPGALPRLRLLDLEFSLRVMMDAWNGSFVDLGLENLGCLEKVNASIECSNATEPEVDAAKEALSHANGAMTHVSMWKEETESEWLQRRQQILERRQQILEKHRCRNKALFSYMWRYK